MANPDETAAAADPAATGGPGAIELVELLFVLVLVAGVGLVYVPAALILGGLLGIVGCERAAGRRSASPAAASDPREDDDR